MLRRARRLVFLLVLLTAVGGGALAITARPELDRTRDDAERRWQVLVEPLGARYELLAAANDAVRAAGGGERDVVRDLDAGLAAWRDALERRALADEVRVANDLEGLARRLEATVGASPVLAGDAEVAGAVAAFGAAPVPETVRAYQEAAESYERARGGALRRLVAEALGFEAIPSLDLSVP